MDSAVFCFFLSAAILYQGQPLFVSLSLLFLKCQWSSGASSRSHLFLFFIILAVTHRIGIKEKSKGRRRRE
jgi:hypothetical protein